MATEVVQAIVGIAAAIIERINLMGENEEAAQIMGSRVRRLKESVDRRFESTADPHVINNLRALKDALASIRDAVIKYAERGSFGRFVHASDFHEELEAGHTTLSRLCHDLNVAETVAAAELQAQRHAAVMRDLRRAVAGLMTAGDAEREAAQARHAELLAALSRLDTRSASEVRFGSGRGVAIVVAEGLTAGDKDLEYCCTAGAALGCEMKVLSDSRGHSVTAEDVYAFLADHMDWLRAGDFVALFVSCHGGYTTICCQNHTTVEVADLFARVSKSCGGRMPVLGFLDKCRGSSHAALGLRGPARAAGRREGARRAADADGVRRQRLHRVRRDERHRFSDDVVRRQLLAPGARVSVSTVGAWAHHR